MLWKVSWVPFGDQAGSRSAPGLLVRDDSDPPVAVMTKISSSPSRLELKAIWAPSGDQAGRPLLPVVLVSWTCPCPSEFILKTSPERSKAISAPSGDQSGAESSAVMPAVSAVWLAPEELILKMS